MGIYTRTRKQWGAKGHGGSKIDEPVPEVIIHHEAGASMSPDASIGQEEARMRAIDAFHLTVRNWAGGIAYSAVPFPSGNVYEGRGYGRSGAHTLGKNTSALAFMVPGHGDREEMTEACIRGVRAWIGEGVEGGHIVRDPEISAHRDHSTSRCPGDKIYAQRSAIRGVTGPEPDEDEQPEPDPRPVIPSPSPSPSTTVLRRGSKGAAVREWQQKLRRWNPRALPRFGADGDFGAETADWTVRFMRSVGLNPRDPADPRVGPRTIARMEEALSRFRFRHAATIRRGSKGAAVREWQQALMRWNSRALPRFGADGDFGAETADWTSRFMRASGLISSPTSNPVVGPRTRRAMERAL